MELIFTIWCLIIILPNSNNLIMEEIAQPKVAIAGTVTEKKTNKSTQENLDKVTDFVKNSDGPVTTKDIEKGTGLPMFETTIAIMTLVRDRVLKKSPHVGGMLTYSIFVQTEEEKLEAALLPTNTRGPSPKKTSIKNYSKYAFEENNYGKGKLVLALVKSYVLSHPGIKIAEIQEAFPKKLHGKFNVVDEIKGASSKSEKQRRFFLDPNQIIELTGDVKVAVCSQWGSNNINNVIDHATEVLGYEILGIEG